MSEKGAAIAKFRSKMESLEKETGASFEIIYPGFEEALEKNRLYADWFVPGTVIARAKKGDIEITYDIEGELDAVIDSVLGEPVCSFEGKFKPVNIKDALLVIDSDSDLAAIKEHRHASGCTIRYGDNNKLRIKVNNEDVGEIIAADPSVARGILNKDFVTELLSAAGEASVSSPEDASGVYELGSELPDTFLDEESVHEDAPLRTDIPEYDEYMAEKDVNVADAALEKAEETIEKDALSKKPENAASKKAEKGAKKPAKKAASKKKTVTGASDEDSPCRYDLLPLDVIGDFLDKFEDAKEGDFFKDIEAYKKKGEGLLAAAVSFAKGYFADGPEAVMRLAGIAAEIAEKNGEDALMDKDVKAYINSAVKFYLLFLKEGCGENDYIARVLWELVCGESAVRCR